MILFNFWFCIQIVLISNFNKNNFFLMLSSENIIIIIIFV